MYYFRSSLLFGLSCASVKKMTLNGERKKGIALPTRYFKFRTRTHLLPLLLSVKSCKIGIKLRLIHLLFSNYDLDHCLLLLSIAGASMFFPRYSVMGC